MKKNHLSHIFLSTLFREILMHLPFDFTFDRDIALAWCKCTSGTWCSACSTFINRMLSYNSKTKRQKVNNLESLNLQ